MTGFLIKIKHRCPALWRMVEAVNGRMVRFRYPSLMRIASELCEAQASIVSTREDSIRWAPLTADSIPALAAFLAGLPAEALRHFNPHPFGPDDLHRLHRCGSLLMIGVSDGQQLIGYHFLRCFATGRCFHGLVVDPRWQGRGIGRRMWALGAEIAGAAGMDMYATISRDNFPSLTSCRRGCETSLVSSLPGDYLLLRCRPRY